jgi:amino acid transporter
MKSLFKNKAFLLFFLAVLSFGIILGVMYLMLKLGKEYNNIILILFMIIPIILLFLSSLYFIELVWKKTFNQKNADYVSNFIDWIFNEVSELSEKGIEEFKNKKYDKLKKMKKTKDKDIFWIAPIVVLVIALFPLPIGYFTLSRLVVSACALYYAIQFHKRNNTTYTWIYGFLVVLYNPVIPIYLYEKFIWVVVNLITIYIFYKNKK